MTHDLSRRTVLAAGAAALAASDALAAPAHKVPVIDTHVHIFDPRRPQGVPYSGPRGLPPQIATPENYRKLADPAGIVGSIIIEASGWIEDNLWILERAESDPVFVGVVGSLAPDKVEFPEYLGRFAKNPLWRGIRYARVWQNENGKYALRPGIAEGLKLLSQADLSLDMANPNFDLLQGALLATDAAPDLRVVMDHMPSLDPTPETQPLYEQLIKELAQRPNFFIKLSQVIHKTRDGIITPADSESNRARLDYLFDAFGEDRVMFGTDWPNSVGTATVPQTIGLMRAYFADKTKEQAEKYFWRNSARIYKWKKRKPNQPA